MSAAHDNTIPNNLRALVQSSKEYGHLIKDITELDLFQLNWNENKPHPTTFGTVETEIEALLATVAIKQGLAVTPLDLTPQKSADEAVSVDAPAGTTKAVDTTEAPVVVDESTPADETSVTETKSAEEASTEATEVKSDESASSTEDSSSGGQPKDNADVSVGAKAVDAEAQNGESQDQAATQ